MAESKKKIEWNENLEKVKLFATANKRWPSTTAEDDTEKALGQWWSRQKYILNSTEPKTSPLQIERETQLKSLIELHSELERDGIWDKKYNLIVDKIKADRKLWKYATENVEEQKLIRWWNQQKTFARKFKAEPTGSFGGMTQARYDKVIALMRIMGETVDTVPADQPTQVQ